MNILFLGLKHHCSFCWALVLLPELLIATTVKQKQILMMETERQTSVDWTIIVTLSTRSRKKTYDKNGKLSPFFHAWTSLLKTGLGFRWVGDANKGKVFVKLGTLDDATEFLFTWPHKNKSV